MRRYISYVKKIRVASLHDLNHMKKDTKIVKIHYLTSKQEWELVKRI